MLCYIFFSHATIFYHQWLFHEGYFPWGMEIAFVVLPFLYFGGLLREHQAFDHKNRFVVAIICFALWIIFLHQGLYLELARHYWPYFYLVLFEGMIASYFVIILSQGIDKIPILNRIFGWIGKHSLIILLIHNLDMRYNQWDKIVAPQYLSRGYVILSIRIGVVLVATVVISSMLNLWHHKKCRN